MRHKSWLHFWKIADLRGIKIFLKKACIFTLIFFVYILGVLYVPLYVNIFKSVFDYLNIPVLWLARVMPSSEITTSC